MSATAPAIRSVRGPVAETMIGTSPVASFAHWIRISVPSQSTGRPAISARSLGTVSRSCFVETCLRPSVRTALSPRPMPRTTRPG